MLEVAEILRRCVAAYRARHALLPSQARALQDIQQCRTAFFGGHVAQCDHCGHRRYAYHSCRNRHCPKCHGQQTRRWLEQHGQRMLPVPHYLLTFTLPSELRSLCQAHPKPLYGLLLKSAASSLLKLTRDPRYLGAQPAILAVLHTWTRALLYHPHAHLLVSAGGLDGERWVVPKNPAFLVPVRALSVIFRAKMREGLRRAGLLDQVPSRVWRSAWVVHCQPAGSGRKVLEYLARYVFRVAITNSRLEAFDQDQVTFRYRDNRTQQMRRVTLPALEFNGRFLRHTLPKGFAKVRAYGLASASRRTACERLRRMLAGQTDVVTPASTPAPRPPATPSADSNTLCPHCRIGHWVVREILRPQRRFPP